MLPRYLPSISDFGPGNLKNVWRSLGVASKATSRHLLLNCESPRQPLVAHAAQANSLYERKIRGNATQSNTAETKKACCTSRRCALRKRSLLAVLASQLRGFHDLMVSNCHFSFWYLFVSISRSRLDVVKKSSWVRRSSLECRLPTCKAQS